MLCLRCLGTLTLFVAISVAPLSAQRPLPVPSQKDAQGAIDREMQQRMQLAQQKKRFEEMKRDSQKLLELATELKQYVDRAGEHVLSIEVLKKADQMEKLARHVKDNMKAN